LQKYVLPATDPALNGKSIGIRQGIKITGDEYKNYSFMNLKKKAPLVFINIPESYFLRAEGALRGWNMEGTAKQFYKKGVRASFEANGLSESDANAYLQNDSYTQASYVDPKNSNNDSPPLNTVTVKWDPSASFQIKLEKIILQKWIALYPNGSEAWAEVRRTGYPKLYPVKINHSPYIPDGKFVRRIPYPSSMKNSSKDQIDKAVNKYLNGNDTGYEPIWWMDVK
jgi:hypothetical protein